MIIFHLKDSAYCLPKEKRYPLMSNSHLHELMVMIFNQYSLIIKVYPLGKSTGKIKSVVKLSNLGNTTSKLYAEIFYLGY